MDSKPSVCDCHWLDRETGTQFIVLLAGEGQVLLSSVDGREVCSLVKENLPRRFAPALPVNF